MNKYKTLLIPVDSELNETNKEIEIRRSELNNIASKTEEINNKIVSKLKLVDHNNI